MKLYKTFKDRVNKVEDQYLPYGDAKFIVAAYYIVMSLLLASVAYHVGCLIF